jgi:hypothetical protein
MGKSVLLGAAGIVLAALAPHQNMAEAADTRIQCDFRALERAQKAAQRQGPALIGAVSDAMTPVPMDAVYVIDKKITRKVMAQDLFARRTPAGSVEVIARLVNCTDFPLQVQGRVSFMDEMQFPTENPSAWQTVFLEPRTFGVYKEVSIGGAEVANYMIEIKGNE